MPIIEDEVRKIREAKGKLEKERLAKEKEEHGKEVARRKKLALEDQQAFLAQRYKPGMIVVYFNPGDDPWGQNNRFCRVVSLLPPPKLYWANEDEGLLSCAPYALSFKLDFLKYTVVTIAQPPLYLKDDVDPFEVNHYEIISLDEIHQVGGIQYNDLRLVKPQGTFNPKAYYSENARVGGVQFGRGCGF